MVETLLEISLLGRVEIKQAGRPVGDLSTRKAEALLIYLVCTGQTQSRDVLTALFWPEHSHSQARRYFRNTLYRLRQALKPYIVSTRQTVAFNQTQTYRLDLIDLEHQLNAVRSRPRLTRPDAAALAQALTLYQGDFLAGFHLDGAPDFETWAALERERLHRFVIEGMHQLVSYYLEAADYAAGLNWVQRLLALDAFDEAAHSQMLRLLSLNGQRGAALTHYDCYARALDAELGVEPGPEIGTLYEQIRDGLLDRQAEDQNRAADVAPSARPDSCDSPRPDPYLTLNRLNPLPNHHLFGVEQAQAKLQDMIQRPGPPWLIAIDGIGGIGGIEKTSLAQALVYVLVQEERFYDIGWVSAKQEEFLPGVGLQANSQPALTEEYLIAALLDQLDPRPHLTASLPEKRLAFNQTP